MVDSSKLLSLAGVLGCVVGVVGYVAFGWRFGADSGPAALAAVALALGREFQARQ